MFQKKRQLKKEKSKNRAKTLYALLSAIFILILIIEIGFFYFYFGNSSFISPLSKITSSKVSGIENELSKENISYSSVNVLEDGSYKIILKDGGVAILSSTKEIKQQLSSLQLMLARLTIEGKKLKTLDFRFNNPVVSF